MEACHLYCDNKATISKFENPMQHGCTKHNEIDWHFIKEILEYKIISLPLWNRKIKLQIFSQKIVGCEALKGALYKLDIQDPTIQPNRSGEKLSKSK